jgi:hypothetical protein
MNPGKDTEARRRRLAEGPHFSERRQRQLERMRAEPPALSRIPAKGRSSRHLRLWKLGSRDVH